MFDIEQWPPFLLAKSHQITFHLMRSALDKFGITPPQFATLAFLWRREGLNLKELGALMSIDRTTIGEIINRLEKLGYIRKEDDPEDRRSSILYVSDRGRIIQPEVLEALNEVKIGLNRRLSQQDQEQLVDLLKKFRLNSI